MDSPILHTSLSPVVVPYGVPKIKRLGNRKTTPPPADLSSDYNITPKQAMSLNVPPTATPFVDRPARMKEWGVAPTSEGPKTLQVDWDPQGHGRSGPEKQRSESYTLAEGQGQFIFGQEGKWQDTVDPANLPRDPSGTSEERRAAASTMPGLESERKRPSQLKEFGRLMTYKNLWAPAREVRNPSHVKDLYAESGMPPSHIEKMVAAETTMGENTRRLSLGQKLKGEGTMGEGEWDRPRDFYSTVGKKLNKVSEINITSKSGFHSGGEATTPGGVVIHESGHALHDMVSGLDALKTFGRHMKGAFWKSGPRVSSGEDPHKEGVADAYRAMYETPEGPKGAMDPERDMGYGIANQAWSGEDPVMKHVYETTRLHTMGGSERVGPGPPGPPGSKPEEPAKALFGMEPARKGRRPVLGTLKRLVNPDSDYARTMYGTRKFEGGADLIGEEEGPFDFDAPASEDTTWTERDVRWKTAGRDYADSVLSKVQVSPALGELQQWDAGMLPREVEFRGEQQSMFPDVVPHQDLRENVRELDAENQRSGEEHLNRVKSNLKTWLV